MKRIYFNCLGINNSAGMNVDQVFRNIFIEAKSNPQPLQLISERTVQIQKVSADLPEMPENFQEFDSRNNRLLLQAVEQIRKQIDYFLAKYGHDRIGIVLGTSTSGIEESEKYFKQELELRKPQDFSYYKQEISNAGDFLAAYLNIQGPKYVVSTACTSSAKALIEAKRLIQADLCDAVIVGGVDSLCSLTLNGFDSLDSNASQMTNPFSKNRSGINIGEGAAIFVLSSEVAEVEFLGYGESSDAYHVSSPDPAGIGAEMALRAAIANAQVSSQDIGYINLHGTGTVKNDEMESLVTGKIFGDQVPVSSTKPFIGHTLGAAGAQEAALCFMTLSKFNTDRRLPIHLWDQEKDPSISPLWFARKQDRLEKNVCMSNSFAFGGNNASLIMRGIDR